jgi:hypothetical protein
MSVAKNKDFANLVARRAGASHALAKWPRAEHRWSDASQTREGARRECRDD